MVAAIDYGLASIQSGERNRPPVPAALLVQARIAARSGIGLDTVLRRYFAGYALLGDFIIDEAEASDMLGGTELKHLLRAQASIFDRLLAEVSEEHAREAEIRLGPTEERRAELVQRLLAGEPLDASELAYDLQATHTGLLAKGHGSADAIRELVVKLDRRLLLIRREEDVVWAWLGTRQKVEQDELARAIVSIFPSESSVAIGEPAHGLEGWRLSHRQAQAALPLAIRSGDPFVRYADVALLASMLQDELLATSLRRLYLAPLDQERDGGQTARATLRAYFASDRNVSSAASTLRVSRRTVTNRLRAIEELLGSPLREKAAEIEAALYLAELEHSPASEISI